MKLKNTSIFSKKIVFLNFLATVLVVFFHSGPNLRYGMPLDMNSPFIYLVFVLCQAGVPMFFFLSAVLFYKTCSSYDDIIVKFGRRLKTLLVPYILWNTLFVAIFYVLVHVDVFHQVMNMGQALDSFRDIFIGIIDSRFTPLWFVKVLMFYTLLAPVIYFLLKRKYIFWLAFVAITIKALLCNPQDYDSFWMWLPIYLTGGYFGMYGCEIEKSNMKIAALVTIFVAAYLLVAYDMEFLLIY